MGWVPEKAPRTGLGLARWLTSRGHPLVARVPIKRVWQRVFGDGIVRTPEDLGVQGQQPTHPELLDWLAVELQESGWDLKHMLRLMVTSRTFRQASTRRIDFDDPENRLFSRMPLARMEAEVLRDSILSVAGRLDLEAFGPADGVEKRGDGLVTANSRPGGDKDSWRRSIYILQRRTQRLTILDNFDLPQMNPNCTERNESVVAPQALHLLNSRRIHQLAAVFADRVLEEVGANERKQVERAYLLAISRSPKKLELEAALDGLGALKKRWLSSEGAGADTNTAARRALENFCHALINSASLLYID